MTFLQQLRALLLICSSCIMWAQAPPEANKLVVVSEIKIQGSHLPERGLLQLSGLIVGERVNDLMVNTACHKITSTGLVKSIDYSYDVHPDKAGIVLSLTLVDEKPLLPAKIIPQANEEQLWRAVQADPLLMRELPRTERALSFYTSHLENALKRLGRDNEYVTAAVVGNANGVPSSIVFSIRSYKQLGPGKQ